VIRQHEVKGKVKEKAGQLTNNIDLEADGQDKKIHRKVQKKPVKWRKVPIHGVGELFKPLDRDSMWDEARRAISISTQVGFPGGNRDNVREADTNLGRPPQILLRTICGWRLCAKSHIPKAAKCTLRCNCSVSFSGGMFRAPNIRKDATMLDPMIDMITRTYYNSTYEEHDVFR
jgi:hypothetical protein